jgi:UDP-N-acetylglucosamine diphosphorylase / glucose-1-phosphate thymidylyltransferase / UDP-N-acetylgalactosamine diphosphorylase / glucosamine-1-phosphate N-acetyltransferase / galactosamine-1-phosphate N-acetyltransferase
MLVTMKGVIPAAGRGTRLEPVTLAIPKELLIVGDKAIIEYVIEAMKSVGVTDITVIVGWRKHAILDYLGSGERLGVKLTYVVQDTRDGLAKAVLTTEHLIQDEPFLVVLGDNFFYPQTFIKELLAFHTATKADATIGVAEIEDPARHGIIQPGSDNHIIDLVEKPQPKDAPSNLGIIGVYIFSSFIFDAIKKIRPGVNNEYQLTDAIKKMIQTGHQVYYKKIDGKHIDIGTMNDLKKANQFLSQQEPL